MGGPAAFLDWHHHGFRRLRTTEERLKWDCQADFSGCRCWQPGRSLVGGDGPELIVRRDADPVAHRCQRLPDRRGRCTGSRAQRSPAGRPLPRGARRFRRPRAACQGRPALSPAPAAQGAVPEREGPAAPRRAGPGPDLPQQAGLADRGRPSISTTRPSPSVPDDSTPSMAARSAARSTMPAGVPPGTAGRPAAGRPGAAALIDAVFIADASIDTGPTDGGPFSRAGRGRRRAPRPAGLAPCAVRPAHRPGGGNGRG